MQNNKLRALLGVGAAMAALVVVTAFSLAIDWSSFTDAVTSAQPDIISLATALVPVLVILAVVLTAVRYVPRLVTRFMK